VNEITPRRNMSGLTTGFPPMRVGFARLRRSRYGDIHHSGTICLRSPRRRELLDNDDDIIIGTDETNLHDSHPCYSTTQDNDGGIWYRLEEHTAG
jgi:hypothetical protein